MGTGPRPPSPLRDPRPGEKKKAWGRDLRNSWALEGVTNRGWLFARRGKVEFATWRCKDESILQMLVLYTGKLRPRERRRLDLAGVGVTEEACAGVMERKPDPGLFHSLIAPPAFQKQTENYYN